MERVLYQKALLLAVLLATEGILTCPSVAAPTVKKLGDAISSNTLGTTNKQTMTKLSTTNQKTPSVRALSLSTKPTSSTAKGTNLIKTTSQTMGSGNSGRTPGLHGNLIKGISSKLSSNYTSPTNGGATSDLTQRITDLESEMATKQDILEPGNGISVDGNIISLSDEMATLPEKMEKLAKDFDELNKQFDTDNYYTVDETQEYLQRHYYTKQYVDEIIGQLSGMNVVDHFDPGFLTQSSGGQP